MSIHHKPKPIRTATGLHFSRPYRVAFIVPCFSLILASASGTIGKALAQPANKQLTSTRPATTQPISEQLASTQPSTTQPATTQSATTQQAPSLALARHAFLVGDFDQATAMYETLALDRTSKLTATIGLAAIDLHIGRYEKGIEKLSAIENIGRRSADWHTMLGSLLAATGEYEKAIRHFKRAIATDEEHFHARWELGRLYEQLGNIKEALTTYQFFEDVMLEGPLPEAAEELTCLGNGFYRLTVLKQLNGKDLVRRTRHILREVYQEAFEFVEPYYWPARLAAAELILQKHNLLEAKEDFERILKDNAKVTAAHVGLGRIALESWQFEDAEKHAQAGLKVNPGSVAAHLLLADTRLLERRYLDAVEMAKAAIDTNPNSIEALSTLAAAQLRAGDVAAYQKTCSRVTRINPRPACLHHTLGVWLSGGRQYEDAEQHFKKAIEFAPWWPEPRTELGLLYMETGDKGLARQALERSFAIDNFNTRTHDVLDLLDTIDKFATLETKHFIIVYDRVSDAAVAPYFAESLEGMYAEVCGHFEVEPSRKTIIELFPSHFDFSRRIAGRPFVATIGACTGRVIAMASPRGEAPFGQFNWASVLRHEFTHTVTLDMTKNRIPHWFTEGLAVYEEPAPRSWTWKRELCDAVRRDHLFDLDHIDWGFMRPRRPNDRMLAYAQSEWMVEYIIERFEYKAILGLLSAIRQGKHQEQAFEQVLKTDTTAFFAEFKEWADEQVDAWDLPPTQDIEEAEAIREKLETQPDDPVLLAKLGRAELLNGEIEDAEISLLAALQVDPKQVIALEYYSRLLIHRMLNEIDPSKRAELIDKVEPYLRRLIRLEPDNLAAMKYLGYVEQSWKQWREAIRWLTRYQKRCPENPDPYRRLAAIFKELKNTDVALRQMEQLFTLVENEPAVAKEIAKIYTQRGDSTQAAAWYRRAISIAPYDADTHCSLGDACLANKNFLEAEREFNVAVKLDPNNGAGYAGLSRVHHAIGNPSKARRYKETAEALGERGP